MDPFAHELYNQITIKRKIDPRDLARKIGVTMDTIYRYDRDDVRTPLFRARQIVAVTGEIALAKAMLEGTGFLPVAAPEGQVTPDQIDKEQIKIFLQCADAIKNIQEYLEDGVLDTSEIIAIQKLLDDLVIRVESLRLKLKDYRR